jgi:hypothetical protein
MTPAYLTARLIAGRRHRSVFAAVPAFAAFDPVAGVARLASFRASPGGLEEARELAVPLRAVAPGY